MWRRMDGNKNLQYSYLICNLTVMTHLRESGTGDEQSSDAARESSEPVQDEFVASHRDEITEILDQARSHAGRNGRELAPLTAAQEAQVHQLMGDAYLSIGELGDALEEYSAGGAIEKLLDVAGRFLERRDLENAERAYRAAGRELPREQYLAFGERILVSSPESAVAAFRKVGAIARLVEAADLMRARGDTDQTKALDLYWEAQSWIPDNRILEIADLFLDALRLAQARVLYARVAAEIPADKLVAYASKKLALHWGDGVMEPYAIHVAVEIYAMAGAGDRLVQLALDLIERKGRREAWRQALQIFLKANVPEQIDQLAAQLLADGELIASIHCQEASGRKADVELLLRSTSKAKCADRVAAYVVAIEEAHLLLADRRQAIALEDTRGKLLASVDGCFQELEGVTDHDELVPRVDYLERAVCAVGRDDLARRLAIFCEEKDLPLQAARIYAAIEMVGDARRIAKKLLRQNKLEDAKAAYEAATLDPHDDFVAWGSHMIQQGRVKAGIAAHQAVGREAPKELILDALRSRPHACKSLEELLSLFHECEEEPDAESLSTFGDLQLRAAHWSEAVEAYRLAARDLPKDRVLECADYYLAQGDLWNGEVGYALVRTTIPPEKLRICAAEALRWRGDAVARRCMELIVGEQTNSL